MWVALAISAQLHAANPSEVAAQRRVSAAYGNLPLRFEANHGQTDERVTFLSGGAGYRLFLTRSEAVLRLHSSSQKGPAASDDVVRIRLARANQMAKVTGHELQQGTSNYFVGSDPAQWHVDVPNYARVRYTGVYPGIDLEYYGNQRQLEYDFIVGPGADPRCIELVFDGVRRIHLDNEGNLVLGTRQGDIVQHKPRVFQDIGGERRAVDGHYMLLAKGHVGFALGHYETAEPLRIDPVVTYATYLGGNFNDFGQAIAVDSAGNAYVTGPTGSSNFPGANLSPIQASQAGNSDVYVAKLNADGTALLYSTYLGGSGFDDSYAIAVDAAGNAYVTGETDSGTPTQTSVPFPTLNAFQGTYHLGGDAFITKLNAAGNAIIYSTFMGGTGFERGYGIAVDSSGSAYVTGHTNSVVLNCGKCYPVAAAFQGDNAGSTDAFVLKVGSAGALIYNTFLGGKNSEYSLEGGGIAVDSNGNAYVTGNTASTDFPGAGASTIQPINGGGNDDAFVAKFNAAGILVYSTYLGGSGYDAGYGIAVDSSGSAYVAGYTDSPNFPTFAPFQATKGAAFGNDAFVAKINAAGSALSYSTYLGGNGGDVAYGIAVDSAGNAYVSGWTQSSDFPTVAPVQPANAGTGDAFISVFNATGSALTFSTYFGGSRGSEHGYGIALDGAGNVYVAGETNSGNFPATARAFQTSFGGGGYDAFVIKLTSHGDANGDGQVTVADIFYLINSLFANGPAPVGSGDANGDGQVTVADIFYLINYLFAGGPAPR